jgi:hypothetical protein
MCDDKTNVSEKKAYVGDLLRLIRGLGICSVVLAASSACAGWGQAWTPAETNALVMWYDASDASTILTSGSTVTNWLDKSTNSLHLTSKVNNPSYTRTINGRSAIDFDNCKLYTTNSHPLQGNKTMMIASVIIYDTFRSSANGLFQLGYVTGSYIPAWMGGSTNGYMMGSSGSWSFYGTVTTQTPLIQIGTRLAGDHAFQNSMYTNGATATYTGNWAQGQAKPSICNGLMIGDGRGAAFGGMSSYYLDGAVGEIVVCSSTNTDLRVTLEGYLAWKWGLVADLPADHPYKSIRPGLFPGTRIYFR